MSKKGQNSAHVGYRIHKMYITLFTGLLIRISIALSNKGQIKQAMYKYDPLGTKLSSAQEADGAFMNEQTYRVSIKVGVNASKSVDFIYQK